MELPFDPVIPLLGIYPKNPDTPMKKKLFSPMFIATQFLIAKCWKQPKCPSVDEWLKRLWYIYTQWNTMQQKIEGIPTFCDNIVGTGDYYAK